MKRKSLLVALIFVIVLSCGCGEVYDDYSYEGLLGEGTFDISESEYKDSCEEITYTDFRYEKQFQEDHKRIKCTGQVEQIVDDKDEDGYGFFQYRVAITKKEYEYIDEFLYVDDIYVYYLIGDGPKLLEGDLVTLYGEVTESVTYTTVDGAERTIPAIIALYVDFED